MPETPGLDPSSFPAPQGVFGGTFDPVHYGHLRLAEEAAEALGLSSVRWIPAGQPALRAAPQASAAHRLAMTRCAIADNPRFILDDAEVASERVSYTVPTLERLRRAEVCGSRQPLVLLTGVDAFLRLEAWHRWQQLFELAHIAVVCRPGYSLRAEDLSPALAAAFRARCVDDLAALSASPAGRIVAFAMTPLDISATRIRAFLVRGMTPRYLLPDAVIDYIRRHNLYTEH